MTVDELKRRIDIAAIPRDAVALNDGLKDEAYVIEGAGTHWTVFYSERGLRSGEREFASEDSACQFLWDWLCRTFSCG